MTPYYQDDAVTIYHGDCREILPGLPKFDLVLTDPPYGINLNKHRNNNGQDWYVHGDKDQQAGFEALAMLDDLPTAVFAHCMKPWPGPWRQFLVWDKGPAVGGGGDVSKCWKQSWELIQIRNTPPLNGPRDEGVIRHHISPQDLQYHPTQKPLGLLIYLIQKIPSTLILDPFMGSGTTLRAAKDLGKKAIGIEIEEKYCEVAAKRMAQEVLF